MGHPTQVVNITSITLMVPPYDTSVPRFGDDFHASFRRKMMNAAVMRPVHMRKAPRLLNPGFMMARMDHPNPPKTRPLMGAMTRTRVARGQIMHSTKMTPRMIKSGMGYLLPYDPSVPRNGRDFHKIIIYFM